MLRRYPAAAPRAAGQLSGRCTAGIELFGIPNVLNCLVAVLSGTWGDLVPDPQTDREWFAPQSVIASSGGLLPL